MVLVNLILRMVIATEVIGSKVWCMDMETIIMMTKDCIKENLEIIWNVVKVLCLIPTVLNMLAIGRMIKNMEKAL